MKIAVFIVLLGLAAWSRSIVRRRRPVALSAAVATETAASAATPPADPDVRNLRWSVGRRVRLRHRGARDHRDARERAAGAWRALIPVLDGVPRADDADRPAHLARPRPDPSTSTSTRCRRRAGTCSRPSVTATMSLPVEGHRPDRGPAGTRRAEPLHRVRRAGHAGRRYGHLREQVLDPVLGQVADRDPCVAQRSSTRSRCRRRSTIR